MTLSAASHAAGRREEAKAALELALRVDPKSFATRVEEVLAHFRGKLDEAWLRNLAERTRRAARNQ